VINREFIILYELEKIFYIFSNGIDCEIVIQGEMIFENSLILIQIINDYSIKNKYNLIEQTHFML
jgi:hypothetical protein